MSNVTGSRLAAVLRWPFLRWRNMAVTGALLLALIIVQGQISSALRVDAPTAAGVAARGSSTSPAASPAAAGAGDQERATSPTSSAAGSPTSAPVGSPVDAPVIQPSSSPSSPAVVPTTVPAAVAQGPAEQTAQSFMTAWSATGDAGRWHEQVAVLATPSYAADLNGTDPERVPVSKVGVMVSSVVTNDGLQTVTFDTDAGPIAVQVTNTGAGWLVSEVEPVEQPPGAPALDLGDLGGGS